MSRHEHLSGESTSANVIGIDICTDCKAMCEHLLSE